MTRSELQAKIDKMEAGLNNPNIQGAAKAALEQSLSKAKEQLAGMAAEKPAKPKAEKAKPKPTPKKKPAPKPAFDWKQQAPLDQLQPITLHCQHYHLEVQADTKVSLKRTGNTSITVTAKKGEHLIFDDQGYPVFIMEPKSFARKCTEKRSITDHKKAEHQSPKAAKPPQKKKAAATKPKPAKKKQPTEGQKVIARFDKEINTIREKQKKPTEVEASLRDLLATQQKSALQKNYQEYVSRRIKRLQKDGVRVTKAEIIKIGIALRPMIQSLRGSLADVKAENAKVLEPNLDNLIRWTKQPGQYDLAGVDTTEKKKPTVKAKVKPQEKQGWLKWVFGE